MLTREMAISTFQNNRIVPDRLTRARHAHYPDLAARMLDVYRNGIGCTREELHRDLRAVFSDEVDCPVRRIEAFCKLLDEESEYEHESGTRAAELRIKVFRAAARLHPLVVEADPWFEHEESTAKEQIAAELNTTWPELSSKLFCDLLQFHRLKSFHDDFTPRDLLARYNVAQVQVCLFDAVKMKVQVQTDFKEVLRYAKLAGLMHRIERSGEGYVLEFDGPASLLQSTHRYGTAMAKFLPGLLACRRWRMKALLKIARWNRHAVMELDSDCGLSSRTAVVQDFDSSVEQKFAEKWGTEPREGWSLERESEILHAGQKVFIPDFTFQHTDGRRVCLEIVGFWTPEYLQQKLATLETFREHRLLLAVQESSSEMFEGHSEKLVRYKTVLKVDAVLEKLRNFEAS
ncbi:MAG: DUF790 family protein [Pirellulales bacterium]